MRTFNEVYKEVLDKYKKVRKLSYPKGMSADSAQKLLNMSIEIYTVECKVYTEELRINSLSRRSNGRLRLTRRCTCTPK